MEDRVIQDALDVHGRHQGSYLESFVSLSTQLFDKHISMILLDTEKSTRPV